MKRYPPKSIVTFLFLTMSVLVLVVAFVLQIRGEQACAPEQRAAALAKAAEARAARADIKARLKMGSMSLQEALDSDDDNVGKLKVVSMLESLPGVGKVKARRVMEEIGIADNRRVQGLGAQQRAALLQQLG